MIHLMDSQTGQTRSLGSHKAQAVTVKFSPDGDYLFSGGWEGELICWDTRVMRRTLTIGHRSWTAQFRSDGQKCALVSSSKIELFSFVRPKQRQFSEDLGLRLRHATFSPDGRWLAAASDQCLGLWDLTGSGPGVLLPQTTEARSAFTEDGKEFFASSANRASHWRLAPAPNSKSPPLLQPVPLPVPNGFTSLALVSNVVVITGDTGSGVADVQNVGTAELRLFHTSPGINGISPDGRWLGIYRPFDYSLYVYALPGMAQVAILTNQTSIGDFAFSPAGNEIAVSSRRGVEFWSTNTWTRTRVLTNFTSILFSPTSSTCWLTSDFRTAGLYRAATLEPLLPLPLGTLPLGLSPDGRHLVVSVDMRLLQLWDLEDIRDQLRDLGLDWQMAEAEAADHKR
jgi:WD40 repeat protein